MVAIFLRELTAGDKYYSDKSYIRVDTSLFCFRDASIQIKDSLDYNRVGILPPINRRAVFLFKVRKVNRPRKHWLLRSARFL